MLYSIPTAVALVSATSYELRAMEEGPDACIIRRSPIFFSRIDLLRSNFLCFVAPSFHSGDILDDSPPNPYPRSRLIRCPSMARWQSIFLNLPKTINATRNSIVDNIENIVIIYYAWFIVPLPKVDRVAISCEQAQETTKMLQSSHCHAAYWHSYNCGNDGLFHPELF